MKNLFLALESPYFPEVEAFFRRELSNPATHSHQCPALIFFKPTLGK